VKRAARASRRSSILPITMCSIQFDRAPLNRRSLTCSMNQPSDKGAIPLESGALDDGETARAADELFAMLDAEEHDARSR
jgi:hypothetical protein